MGATPEPLVRLRDGVVVSRPIAGTRRRGQTDAEDDRLAGELSEHPKEVAEHVMLVDLARNDVGRVVRFGTEHVDEFKTVERYSHVMHLTSQVSGRLAPGKGPIDVLRATIPAGTLSGAPKVRAMQIIDDLEPTKRGVYGGVVGYVDFSGNLDTAIAIRTMVVTPDGRASVQAGAGIVADSDPVEEDIECHNKAAALLAAVPAARRRQRQRRTATGPTPVSDLTRRRPTERHSGSSPRTTRPCAPASGRCPGTRRPAGVGARRRGLPAGPAVPGRRRPRRGRVGRLADPHAPGQARRPGPGVADRGRRALPRRRRGLRRGGGGRVWRASSCGSRSSSSPWRGACVALRGPRAAAVAAPTRDGAGTSLAAGVLVERGVGGRPAGRGARAPDGVRVCSAEAWEAVRVEAGIPSWAPSSTSAPSRPRPTSSTGAVSFTKGCYTGQELVARLDARGNRVARHLRGLVVVEPDASRRRAGVRGRDARGPRSCSRARSSGR